MNRTLKTIAAGLALAFTAVLAQAQPSTPTVDKREARQQARIAQGAASGALNARETQRLERQQARINQAEANAKADGVVTKKERANLRARQNKANRDIYREKHDAQTAKP
jgi:hypothetical protein